MISAASGGGRLEVPGPEQHRVRDSHGLSLPRGETRDHHPGPAHAGRWLPLIDLEAARAEIDKNREEFLATSASDLVQALESVLSAHSRWYATLQ